MCGPLIIAVNAARRQQGGSASMPSVSGYAFHNLAYHSGRILTYTVLGAISGFIGAAIALAGFQRWISVAAGGLVLLGCLTPLGLRGRGLAGRVVSMVKSKFSLLLRDRKLGATALLGGLNGLLPCGLVYIACAAAATSGGVGAGVTTMLAFGLGTIPIMMAVCVAGKVIRWNHPLAMQRVVLVCATLAGLLLIVRGLSLGIPYLSPQFQDGLGPTCPCLHG